MVTRDLKQDQLDALRHSILEEIASAVGRARQSPHPNEADLLEHVYVSRGTGGAVPT